MLSLKVIEKDIMFDGMIEEKELNMSGRNTRKGKTKTKPKKK